jgi:NADH-quinone oxidoreductase subunit E
MLNIERPGDPAVFADEVRVAAQEIMARYPEGQSRSALLPMLHLVQSEQGFVSTDGIAFCADVLGLAKAQVAAVATFYTMYKRKPTGDYLVSVCTNTLCGMLGGDEIYATLSELLGVGHNETTADGKITLEHAECLAACDYAPVATVNYEFFDNQTQESAAGIVNELRNGARPLPTRGAPLCSFKEISRQIAGFVDQRPESVLAAGTGVPTEAGTALSQELGQDARNYSIEGLEPDGATKRSSSSKADKTAQASPALGQPTSAHDAPLKTSQSDAESGKGH